MEHAYDIDCRGASDTLESETLSTNINTDMVQDGSSREGFDEAARALGDAQRQADAEEARYRTTSEAESKDAADRLIASWDRIADARRKIAELYKNAVEEAARLNSELDDCIRTFGPESREVADFRARITGQAGR